MKSKSEVIAVVLGVAFFSTCLLSVVMLKNGIALQTDNQQYKTELSAALKQEKNLKNVNLSLSSQNDQLKTQNDKLSLNIARTQPGESQLNGVSELINNYLDATYISSSRNLKDRYIGISKYLTGEAVSQLKPNKYAENTDDGYNDSKISGVQVNVPVDEMNKGTFDVLATYTLASKSKTNLKSPMVLQVTITKVNKQWKIANVKRNVGFSDAGFDVNNTRS